MPSSILNSDDGVISGTSGLKTTGGDDGVLKIQNNGVDAITVADDGEVTFAAGLAIASPIVFPAGTASLPAITTTGDLNTGIYFPAADTIGFVCGGTEDFRVDGDGQLWNTVNSQVGTDYTTLYKGYLCRAWVDFDGTLSAASMIQGSGNVSSITDQGTGDYRVNFTTSMPDANYASVMFNWLGAGTGSLHYTSNLGKNVAYVDFEIRNSSAVNTDASQCNVAIFR